jgi:copper chaperone
MKIAVENMKCGGCATSISKKLSDVEGVTSIHVDIDSGVIEIEGEFDLEEVTQKLDAMGYPIAGQNNLLKKTKSYVSCAIGKMSQDD